jgi:glycerol uptake facilitator-like aquaporin
VTIGLWSAGRCAATDVVPYIVAQVIGAIAAAAVLWVIASSQPGWVAGGFAANGYGDLSPGKYGLGGCFLTEVVMTFFFLFIIIGSTSKGAASGFAGIPIGLAFRNATDNKVRNPPISYRFGHFPTNRSPCFKASQRRPSSQWRMRGC